MAITFTPKSRESMKRTLTYHVLQDLGGMQNLIETGEMLAAGEAEAFGVGDRGFVFTDFSDETRAATERSGDERSQPANFTSIQRAIQALGPKTGVGAQWINSPRADDPQSGSFELVKYNKRNRNGDAAASDDTE